MESPDLFANRYEPAFGADSGGQFFESSPTKFGGMQDDQLLMEIDRRVQLSGFLEGTEYEIF